MHGTKFYRPKQKQFPIFSGPDSIESVYVKQEAKNIYMNTKRQQQKKIVIMKLPLHIKMTSKNDRDNGAKYMELE